MFTLILLIFIVSFIYFLQNPDDNFQRSDYRIMNGKAIWFRDFLMEYTKENHKPPKDLFELSIYLEKKGFKNYFNDNREREILKSPIKYIKLSNKIKDKNDKLLYSPSIAYYTEKIDNNTIYIYIYASKPDGEFINLTLSPKSIDMVREVSW